MSLLLSLFLLLSHRAGETGPPGLGTEKTVGGVVLSAGTTAAGAAISALASAIPTGGAIIATALTGQGHGPGQTQSTAAAAGSSSSIPSTTGTVGTGAYDTPLTVPPTLLCLQLVYLPSYQYTFVTTTFTSI